MSPASREVLMSLTRADFQWEFFRAGGNGGQKQNKTSTGVRVRHEPSGAVAESREATDQLSNKRLAFRKITKDPVFRAWLRITAQKMMGMPTPEEVVERSMSSENLRFEVKDEHGRWTEVDGISSAEFTRSDLR